MRLRLAPLFCFCLALGLVACGEAPVEELPLGPSGCALLGEDACVAEPRCEPQYRELVCGTGDPEPCAPESQGCGVKRAPCEPGEAIYVGCGASAGELP